MTRTALPGSVAGRRDRAAEGDRAGRQVLGEQVEQPRAGQADVRVAVARRRLGDIDADQELAPVITGLKHVDGRADAVEAHAELGQDARAVGPERHRGAAVPQLRCLLEHGDLVAVRDERPGRGETADPRAADQHLHERLPSVRYHYYNSTIIAVIS